MYRHCRTTKRCPKGSQPRFISEGRETYLERHEQGLALNVRETQVHAAGVAVGVTISDDMLDLRGYAIDEAVRELRDAGVIPLGRKVSMQVVFTHDTGSLSTPAQSSQRSWSAHC